MESEGYAWDLQASKCHNPGGDCDWVWGGSQEDSIKTAFPLLYEFTWRCAQHPTRG